MSIYIHIKKFRADPDLFSKRDIAYMCGHQKLSKKFMREFKDKLSWKDISFYQQLDEKFIEQMKDYVCWRPIYNGQRLSEQFVERHINDEHFEWQYVCHNYKIHFSKQFVKKHYYEMNIMAILEHATMDEEIWRTILNDERYKDEDFTIALHVPKLSIDFIREFRDKLNLNQRLAYIYNHDDHFFDEFGDKLTRRGFSHYSESWKPHSIKLLRRYQRLINWHLIHPEQEVYSHTKEQNDEIKYLKAKYTVLK